MPNEIFYVCIFMEYIKGRFIIMQNRIHALHAGCGLTDYSNMVSKQKCIIAYKEYEEINYLLNLTIPYCVLIGLLMLTLLLLFLPLWGQAAVMCLN